jgi:hypothetical protein
LRLLNPATLDGIQFRKFYNNKIPKLKHQITNKSQFSMTKRAKAVASYSFAKPVCR